MRHLFPADIVSILYGLSADEFREWLSMAESDAIQRMKDRLIESDPDLFEPDSMAAAECISASSDEEYEITQVLAELTVEEENGLKLLFEKLDPESVDWLYRIRPFRGGGV